MDETLKNHFMFDQQNKNNIISKLAFCNAIILFYASN